MSEIWMQSLNGAAIDMVDTTDKEVDFREIADVLARINRYGGNAVKPISVAQHTIIACHAAPQGLVPWVLLHDAHEARIGDITTPAAQALAEIAEQLFPAAGKRIIDTAIHTIKRRHDVAIHTAAGLAMPIPHDIKAIKQADLIALATERRDFLSPCSRPWDPAVESVKPLPRIYTLKSPADVADRLYSMFCDYLPALQSQHRLRRGGISPLIRQAISAQPRAKEQQ